MRWSIHSTYVFLVLVVEFDLDHISHLDLFGIVHNIFVVQ